MHRFALACLLFLAAFGGCRRDQDPELTESLTTAALQFAEGQGMTVSSGYGPPACRAGGFHNTVDCWSVWTPRENGLAPPRVFIISCAYRDGVRCAISETQ